MRYSTVKLGAAHFLGKATITLIGAYTAKSATLALESLFGDNATIIGSIILSILAVTIILRTDPSNLQAYISKFRALVHRTRKPSQPILIERSHLATPVNHQISVASGKTHNDKMEHMNGEIRDREKVVRGVRKTDSPLIEGYRFTATTFDHTKP